MENFTWWNPTIVIFGKGTIPQIADQLAAIKAKSVLLVYGGKEGTNRVCCFYHDFVMILF